MYKTAEQIATEVLAKIAQVPERFVPEKYRLSGNEEEELAAVEGDGGGKFPQAGGGLAGAVLGGIGGHSLGSQAANAIKGPANPILNALLKMTLAGGGALAGASSGHRIGRRMGGGLDRITGADGSQEE